MVVQIGVFDRNDSDRFRLVRIKGLFENIEGLEVEVVRGDVLNVEDCRASVDGVDTLFHAAAIYKAWMPQPRPISSTTNGGYIANACAVVLAKK